MSKPVRTLFALTACAAIMLAAGIPIASAAADAPLLESFAFEGNEPESGLSYGKSWDIADDSPDGGSRALKLDGRFPGDYSVTLSREKSWWEPQRIRFRIYVEDAEIDDGGDHPPGELVQVSISAVTYDHIWFQHDVPGFIAPGQWRQIDVTLDPERRQWNPGGHFAMWTDATRSELRQFIVKVYSNRGGTAAVYLDDIELVGPGPMKKPPLEATAAQIDADPLRLLDFRASAAQVGRYEKFEITFRTNWTFVNPFDDAEVRVTGVFVPERGPAVRVPGFYYQGFRRQLTPGHGERANHLVEDLIPVGPRLWKIRFAPRVVGPYTYRVEIEVGPRDAPIARIRTSEASMECVESQSPGFVRLSAKDHRYFETDDGAFFFPRGHNIISPWDEPYGQVYVKNLPIGKRTYAYDRYFERMGRHRANLARVWMSYWWVGLEWSEGQGPYYGIGRYSLQNAWRLDHLLETAQENGIYLLLEIFTHVSLSTRLPTPNESGWRHNPYNRANGGFLASPWDFFTDDEASARTKTLLRYIVARWGYSANVFAWSMFSEVDLVDNFYTRGREAGSPVQHAVVQWHAQIMRHLKTIDTNGMHMVTSHHHQPKAARPFFEIENMDFITSNAYASTFLVDDQVPAFLEYCEALDYLRKPNLITEFGGHWGGSPRGVMERDFHSGLWFSVASPLAGTPLFWWWNLVDDANLYPQYGALANFIDGEDFRNPDAKQQNDRAIAPKPEDDSELPMPLGAVSFGDRQSRRIWVFNQLNTTRISPYNFTVEGARLHVFDLRPGRYVVEFWDTFDPKRGRIATRRAESREGLLDVEIPAFDKDLAIKVKPAE